MKFVTTILSLLLASTLFAHQHGGSIHGLVTEAETNIGLPGAQIYLLETGQSTASNELGLFSFTDLEGGEYTLYISYIGFERDTLLVRVNDHETSPIRVSLQPKDLNLADVQVSAQKERPLQTLSALDLHTRPLQSAQDVLRFVPGIVIAQHAGGGKAEQIFLRGFDIDHGTDIALYADGLPVNMVSHAHGQGYADLHFVMPELIEQVNFQKGLYDARVGNFATAGFVKFETPDVLPSNLLKLEVGQFNQYRSVAALDLLGQKAAARGLSAYIAAETMFNDGYFEASQNFKRVNLFGKFRQTLDERQTLNISLSRFRSSWLASGQIPERAIESGQITWFGAIDPNEGGQTGRQNLNIEHLLAVSEQTLVKNQFFLTQYDFELYSNFTFFLNDPVNGDQIRQKEKRFLTGYNGSVQHQTSIFGKKLALETGLNLRYDEISGNELSRTRNRRETLRPLALGDVQEINAAPYVSAAFDIAPKWTLDAGLRAEIFHFSYQNALDSAFSLRTAAKKRLCPKLNLHWQARPNLQFFALSGIGLHSNDTRVVVAETQENVLPLAFGNDLGLIFKPSPRLLVSAALWQLFLQQEFVYVGDEGVVEPSGRTLRRGFDLSARWQLSRGLFFDADYNWTRPRSQDEPEGAQFIPLAPTQTCIGGLTFSKNAWQGSLRYRWLADRPANEDYSLRATGWFLMDAQITWSPKTKNGRRPLECSFSLQNLGDVRWKEAQFETESRLPLEAAPVSEIHFTPGTPRLGKLGMSWRF